MKQTSQNQLKITASQISPSNFMDYRVYLKTIYDFTKAKLKKYSYIQFAVDLGFKGSGVLNQIIRGKRNISSKLAHKISDGLGITGNEKKYFITLVDYNNCKNIPEQDKKLAQLLKIASNDSKEALKKDQLEYFTEWYHPVIRELIVAGKGDLDAERLAKAVQPQIRPKQAQASINLLLRLNLVKKTGRKLVATQKDVRTPRDIEGLVISGFHSKLIDLAKRSLSEQSPDKRSITSITVNMSKDRYEKIKKEIIDFQLEKLSECNEEQNCHQIYQFNVQIFPTSKAFSEEES